MTKTFAVILNGIVDNLIAADTEEIAVAVTPASYTIIEVDKNIGIYVGWTYDAVNNVFIAPQPYPSWLLNDNFKWQAPTPKPEMGIWFWDENNLNWVEAN